jgi:hypothetical protein
MAKAEVTICDRHKIDHGKNVIADDWIFMVKPPGEKEAAYQISLCLEDAEIGIELVRLLEKYGEKIKGGFFTIRGETPTPTVREAVKPPNSKPLPARPQDVNGFLVLIQQGCKARGVTVTHLHDQKILLSSATTSWRKGKVKPTEAMVRRVTKYLDLNRKRVQELTGFWIEEETPPQVEASKRQSIVSAKSPDWAKEVKAKCLVVDEAHPLGCGAKMARGEMRRHAREIHGIQEPGRAVWELLGMPEGVEPVECSCGMPFPTVEQKERHRFTGCPDTREDRPRRTPPPVKPTGPVHKEGRTYGNNPSIGTVTHAYN